MQNNIDDRRNERRRTDTFSHKKFSLMPANRTLETPGRRSTQTRKSSQRLSMVPTNRPVQDTRNIKDKQVVAQSIESLCCFLQKHEVSVNEEQLKNPSTKDVLFLFDWMMRCVDKNFEFSKEPGNDIVSMLKTLGYPHPPSKSVFASAIAPHNWPTLLAILTWLRELLEYDEIMKQDLEQDPTQPFARKVDHGLFYNYVTRAYSDFLATGNSDDELLLKEIEADFTKRTDLLKSEISEKKKRKEEILAEVSRSENEPSRPVFLKKELAVLDSDSVKFRKIVTDFQEHAGKLDKKIERAQKRKSEMKTQIENLKKEQQESLSTLNKQELNQTDVERINKEKLQLEESIQNERLKNVALDSAILEKEMAISAQYDKCERDLTEYHQLCTSLGLLPQTSKNAGGTNFKQTLQNGQLQSDQGVDIKQSLERVLTTLHNKEITKWNLFLEHQTILENMKEEVRRVREDISLLEEENSRLEEYRVERIATLDVEFKKLDEEFRGNSILLEQKKKKKREERDRSEESLKKAQKEYEKLSTLLQGKLTTKITSLNAAYNAWASYKNYVAVEVDNLKKQIEVELETAL